MINDFTALTLLIQLMPSSSVRKTLRRFAPTRLYLEPDKIVFIYLIETSYPIEVMTYRIEWSPAPNVLICYHDGKRSGGVFFTEPISGGSLVAATTLFSDRIALSKVTKEQVLHALEYVDELLVG